MTWMKVETAVARNRKFVKAGPAPSWLWICSLAYCQEGLTDGFIPEEALPFLGVKNAKQLAAHLVAAELWDVVAGGWRVHDYFDHNKTAAEVERIRQARSAGGSLGGRPEKPLEKPSAKPSRLEKVNLTENPDQLRSAQISSDQLRSAQISSATATDGRRSHHHQVQIARALETAFEKDPRLDLWFHELHAAYPESARSSGYVTMTAFCDAVRSKGTPDVTFTVMLGNLANQKRGYQWRVKGMIPRLDRWLKEGLWQQVHDEQPPAAEQVTAKTSRTLQAAASILREQGRMSR